MNILNSDCYLNFYIEYARGTYKILINASFGYRISIIQNNGSGFRPTFLLKYLLSNNKSLQNNVPIQKKKMKKKLRCIS